jgi:hypothetical protein
MKERPIIFSGPMVRAILDGRKTQTRRVFKFRETNKPPGCPDKFDPNAVTQPCPYGQPGDRLWARETWRPAWEDDTGFCGVEFRAGGMPEEDKRAGDYMDGTDRWRPSIRMPRWASRITLEVESVRVERLNEISEEDAKAEGIDGWNWDGDVLPFVAANQHLHPAVLKYALLWQSINGPDSWAENPWVWVVTFRRV